MKRKRIKIERIIVLLIIVSLFILGFKTCNMFNDKANYTNNKNSLIRNNETVNLLLLVNKFNKMPKNYPIDLTNFQNYKVASILISDLQDMYDDAKKDGVYLEITSAYRTKVEQQKLFDNKVAEFRGNGNSYNAAREKAERIVSLPKYSEHETGLAIDFSNTSNYDKKLEVWNWLELNAYKYGFVLRYPNGKEHITGIDYEAWHYRYVGREYAKILYENNLTLEEYLNM